MTERNAKKILLQILQQAQDEATSPDPCDLGVLADRFLERWQPEPTWQWAWREAGHPDAVPVPASEATARKQAELDPDTELVRRPVGAWEVVDRG